MNSYVLLPLMGLAGVVLASCNPASAERPAEAGTEGSSVASATASAPMSELDLPRMKSGLWRLTTQVETPVGTMDLPATEVCHQNDEFHQPDNAAVSPDADCEQPRFRRQGDQVVADISCKVQGNQVESRISMTGDFQSQYQTVVQTRMVPAPAPGMETMTMRINSTRMGDCPA